MKRHSKQDIAITKKHKIDNAPKPANADRRRVLERARRIAYLIHDDLHLTFAQCVQLVLTNYRYGHIIANGNIRKYNELHKDHKEVAVLSEFNEPTFRLLLAKRVDFALTANKFKA